MKRFLLAALAISVFIALGAGAQDSTADKSAADKIQGYRASLSLNGSADMNGMKVKMSGTGTMEAQRKGEVTMYRLELDQSMDMGGQKMSMPILTVFDGKDTFVETSMMGQKMVMKMPPNSDNTVMVASKDEILEKMKDTYNTKPLPDESIDGEAVSVYELTPKNPKAQGGPGGASPFARSKMAFSKKTDLPLRFVTFDKADAPLMTITYTNYEINPDFKADRFTYTPPAGVKVRDMSKGPMGGGAMGL